MSGDPSRGIAPSGRSIDRTWHVRLLGWGVAGAGEARLGGGGEREVGRTSSAPLAEREGYDAGAVFGRSWTMRRVWGVWWRVAREAWITNEEPRPVLKMSVRFPAAGQPHWRRHSLVSYCPNSLLALSLPLKPPRSPVISDILFEKRSRTADKLRSECVRFLPDRLKAGRQNSRHGRSASRIDDRR